MGISLIDAANFKAARETCGMSYQYIAQRVGARTHEVEHWERCKREVPEHAKVWMQDRLAEHDRAVADAIKAAQSLAESENTELSSGKRPPVPIGYYRSQREYDQYGDGEGDADMANARARAVASGLRALGYEVVFSYPGNVQKKQDTQNAQDTQNIQDTQDKQDTQDTQNTQNTPDVQDEQYSQDKQDSQ